MQLLAVPPLIVILAAFVTLALAATQRSWSSGFVSWLQSFGRIGVLLGGVTADLAVKMTRYITNRLGGEWRDLERLAVAWVSGAYQWAALAVVQALAWPYYLFRLQSWLLTVELPRLIRALPHAGTTVLHAVTTRVVRIERTVVRLPKLTKAQTKAMVAAAIAVTVGPYLRWLRWLRAHAPALSRVIAHALPLPNVPAIPNLWKRIRALEKRLAVPLGIAAVVAALGRLGLGWIRCGKVRQLGRSVCGLDQNLLESLLLDSLAIFSIVSVVEFANGLRTIEDEAVTILHHLIREFPAPPPTPNG